jgi:hypothetical protein
VKELVTFSAFKLAPKLSHPDELKGSLRRSILKLIRGGRAWGLKLKLRFQEGAYVSGPAVLSTFTIGSQFYLLIALADLIGRFGLGFGLESY